MGPALSETQSRAHTIGERWTLRPGSQARTPKCCGARLFRPNSQRADLGRDKAYTRSTELVPLGTGTSLETPSTENTLVTVDSVAKRRNRAADEIKQHARAGSLPLQTVYEGLANIEIDPSPCIPHAVDSREPRMLAECSSNRELVGDMQGPDIRSRPDAQMQHLTFYGVDHFVPGLKRSDQKISLFRTTE